MHGPKVSRSCRDCVWIRRPHKRADVHVHHAVSRAVHRGPPVWSCSPSKTNRQVPGWAARTPLPAGQKSCYSNVSLSCIYGWNWVFIARPAESRSLCRWAAQWPQLLLFVPETQPEAGFHRCSCRFFLRVFESGGDLPSQWVSGGGGWGGLESKKAPHPLPPTRQPAGQFWCAALLWNPWTFSEVHIHMWEMLSLTFNTE